MSKIIGIDLGTTYCAVTIPEERTGDGFFTVPSCPGYTVILDRFKNRITPSVVAEDSRGEIVVGFPAKARAGFSPEPIMFSKRYMGEDKEFHLKSKGILRPEEVASHILKHLKELAEFRLGEPVTDAVVTVPAYFTMLAKQMTQKAGELAGLNVAQIAQEPVAAALMYCVSDTRDPLRVMTYDLGGGTFDVAVLEKRDGTISVDSIRSFDGDRQLGGYDFDKRLAFWIEGQLIKRGYDLHLSLDNPSDKIIFTKLLIYAERAKIALSGSETYEFMEPNTGIEDHAGQPVVLDNLQITRDEFIEMIEGFIERTIMLSKRALDKVDPPLTADDLDEILMVGGSSRIPAISKRLEEAFKCKPKLIEPDLCVALGAAILAGTKPVTVGSFRLDKLPECTYLPSISVTGFALPTEGLTALEGNTVRLRSADGSVDLIRQTKSNGSFVFDNVELAVGQENPFVLILLDAQGAEVSRHNFNITQSDEGGGVIEAVTNVLAKKVGIDTVDGFYMVAPERTPLPYEKMIRAKTTDDSGKVIIPIVEENTSLGEIIMNDIPSTLPIGSAIEITVTLQENFQIIGRAYIPALAVDTSVVIDIPIPPRRSMTELRRVFEDLQAQSEDALNTASVDKRFTLGKRLKNQTSELEALFNSREAESTIIQDRLDEMDTLVKELCLGWVAEPPKAVFEAKVSEAEELLARAIKSKPKIAEDGYDQQIEAIQNAATQAYIAENNDSWREAFERISTLCNRLDGLTEKQEAGEQDPHMLLLQLAQALDRLQDYAVGVGKYFGNKEKFDDAASSLERIDADSPEAMKQIRTWYHSHYSQLQKAINAPDKISGRVVVPPEK